MDNINLDLKILDGFQLTEEFWVAYDDLVSLTIEHRVQLTSDWLICYSKSYLRPEQIYIFALYQNKKLVGCLPLQKDLKRATRFWNYRNLKPLGDGPSDFFAFPVIPKYAEISSKMIINHLQSARTWDKLVIRNIPISSKGLESFKNELKKRKVVFDYKEPNGFYWVDTYHSAWEDFENSYFKRNNRDLYKSERRLANDNLKLKFKTIDSNIFDNLMNDISIYESRRESLGQLNTYQTPERKMFLEDILEKFERKGQVQYSTLTDLNGIIWAFQLDWLSNGVRYHWNHAYNEEFKRYSPGKLLLKKLMMLSFEDSNIESCNHMRGLSNYKSKLVDCSEKFGMLSWDNNSIRLKITSAISKLLMYIK